MRSGSETAGVGERETVLGSGVKGSRGGKGIWALPLSFAPLLGVPVSSCSEPGGCHDDCGTG